MEAHAVVVTRPRSGCYTVADIDALPEGVRAELYDGQLVMNAAPDRRHQRAVAELWLILRDAIDDDLEAVIAPFDWQLGEDRLVEPDVLVIPRAENQTRFVGTPSLVAEVLSPSTRVVDLTAKHRFYEDAAVPLYLVIDPEVPALALHQLDGGELRKTATAEGDELLHLPEPFGVDIQPSLLI